MTMTVSLPVILLLTAPALASAPGEKKPPRPKGAVLKVEPPEVVFERVYAGQRAEKEVRLTNAGDAPLEIYKVRSSCGCTTAGLKQKLLQPGESTTMTTSFRSSRRQVGKTVHKKITISSNAASGPNTVLPVTARVVAAVLVEPDVLRLAKLEPGRTLSREIRLTASDGKLFKITSAASKSKALRVTIGDTNEALTHTLAVEVRIEPGGLSNRGAAEINVQTTHPRDKRIKIPVSWRVERPLAVKPRRLFLGSCYPGQTVRRTIMVKSKKRDHLDDVSFSLEPATIPLTAARDADAPDSWELTFEIPRDFRPRRVRGTLLIDTHVEPEGTVRVPFGATVSENLDLLPDLQESSSPGAGND